MCRPRFSKSLALWGSYVDCVFTESFVTLIAKCHKDKYVEQSEAEFAQNRRAFFRVISSRDVSIVLRETVCTLVLKRIL